MKEETKLRKMMEALGLADVHQKHVEVKKNLNQPVAVNEEELQNFRAVQGVLYFLQAPALFTLKVCNHCGAEFLVSRKFVANCSYTCIKAGLYEMGIDWNKDEDPESLQALIDNIYDGNEPIWIRNIPALRTALESLTIPNGDSSSKNNEPSVLSS